MPVRHAVLALLAAGPSHGYELKRAFDADVGEQWGPLNIGHLYQVLERLARDGCVTSTRIAQTDKPDRRTYSLTEAGQAELAEWLGRPAERGYRDDFVLQLVAATRSPDPATLPGVLARQRAYLLRELRNLDAIERARADAGPLAVLLVRMARAGVEAELAAVEAAEDAAPSLRAAAPAGRRQAALAQDDRPAVPRTGA